MMVPEVDDMKGGNMHSPPSAPPIPHANLYQQEPSVIGVPVPPPSPGPGGSANHNNNNNNDDDDDEQVVEDGRQEFSNYAEFFLTSVGYCVGLGNLVGMSERGFLFFFFIVRSKPLRCSHSPPDQFASFPHTPTSLFRRAAKEVGIGFMSFLHQKYTPNPIFSHRQCACASRILCSTKHTAA